MRTFDIDDRLPGLTIRYPECSHCGEDVEIEDGVASCPRCLIQWSSISEDAEPEPDPNLDGTNVACGIQSRADQQAEYDYHGQHWQPGPRRPCILPWGHEGDHLHPYSMTVTLLAEAGGPR